MDWFLYDIGLRPERVKFWKTEIIQLNCLTDASLIFTEGERLLAKKSKELSFHWLVFQILLSEILKISH